MQKLLTVRGNGIYVHLCRGKQKSRELSAHNLQWCMSCVPLPIHSQRASLDIAQTEAEEGCEAVHSTAGQ